MDNLKKYSDDEPGGSGGDGDGGGGDKQKAVEANVDLCQSWLAPRPKQSRTEDGRVLIDAEWGLGQEKKATPDEPIDEALVAKLARFHELKRTHDTHFNQSLARSRAFRNPHIYAKLVEWVDVDETASAYGSMVRSTDDDVGRTVWSATTSARRALLAQGSAERIAAEQKRQQEQADEARAHARARGQGRVEFVGSSNGKRSSSSSTSEEHSNKASEAKALAEKRVKLINERSLAAANSATAEQSGEGSLHHHHRHHRRSDHRDRSTKNDEERSYRHR